MNDALVEKWMASEHYSIGTGGADDECCYGRENGAWQRVLLRATRVARPTARPHENEQMVRNGLCSTWQMIVTLEW